MRTKFDFYHIMAKHCCSATVPRLAFESLGKHQKLQAENLCNDDRPTAGSN